MSTNVVSANHQTKPSGRNVVSQMSPVSTLFIHSFSKSAAVATGFTGRTARLLRTVSAGLALVAATGCGAMSPVAPTAEVLEIAPELQAAYNVLTANGAPAAWAQESIGAWASRPRRVQRIVVRDLPTGIQAQFDGADTISLSRQLLTQPNEIVAAFIAHELRHADGLRHECSDGVRDRATTTGAWSVHISVLRTYGRNYEADIIRDHKFCNPS